MSRILVTGGAGQLASILRKHFPKEPFDFVNKASLDICDRTQLEKVLSSGTYSYCINAAAYTAVDLAEKETEKAFQINEAAVKLLAESCTKFNVKLIHISTDFVFDGESNLAYSEAADCNPISVYGASKRAGELAILNDNSNHIIIRTSWLYSELNQNFLKSMIRLSETKTELGIVADQIGSPTYALDLASAIIKMIAKCQSGNDLEGLYHFSNQGVASWYDFAKSIFEYEEIDIKVNAIPTSAYPTPASRPKFSLLDKSKIENDLSIEIPYWRDSLKKCLEELHKIK